MAAKLSGGVCVHNAAGDAGLNIATFTLGRKAEGGSALALLAVDEPIEAAVAAQVAALPHVAAARSVRF